MGDMHNNFSDKASTAQPQKMRQEAALDAVITMLEKTEVGAVPATVCTSLTENGSTQVQDILLKAVKAGTTFISTNNYFVVFSVGPDDNKLLMALH